MCLIPKGFRDRGILLYSSKIVDKNEILHTVSNTAIYCSSGKVCRNIMSWTLSIVLSLSKNHPVYFSKHNVSETRFCLRLQVKPTQLDPIDRASP
jgi:hypothetical protein